MSKKMTDRIDPELAGPAEFFLKSQAMDLHDIPAARAASEKMFAAMKGMLPDIEGVTSEDRLLPGPEGAPEVPVRLYQKPDRPDLVPALVWIHGGGFMFGDLDQEDRQARTLTLAGECLTMTVDYRLAPENPFPAPLEDCYASLKWLASRAGELGIDPARIVIGGVSAGGGLAAGLALLARDRAEVDVAFQFLMSPMLDDCNVSPAGETLPDTLFWTRENNLIGWRSYLGCEPGGGDVSCYASACRAVDLTGLPSAYIAVGELDLFLGESMMYARRLIEACVPTELHVYPGVFHGSDLMAPEAGISRRYNADFHAALKLALHG